MDETLCRVVLDCSDQLFDLARRHSKAETRRYGYRVVRGLVQAFAQNAGITLHVECFYGENSHHIVEACFKGLAQALREAIEIDPRRADAVPSTEGRPGRRPLAVWVDGHENLSPIHIRNATATAAGRRSCSRRLSPVGRPLQTLLGGGPSPVDGGFRHSCRVADFRAFLAAGGVGVPMTALADVGLVLVMGYAAVPSSNGPWNSRVTRFWTSLSPKTGLPPSAACSTVTDRRSRRRGDDRRHHRYGSGNLRSAANTQTRARRTSTERF